MKQRIYRYDNIKALLIFLVVLGHMTTDYVSDSHLVRWTTLWIYTFHMPAFIFLSGLVHKHYITNEKASLGIKGETRMRWDKFLGFFLCGYALKIFLQYSRTLMGQHPIWHWFEEPGIPWYLIVMAEYELLFYLIKNYKREFTPIEVSREIGVTNKTVINRLSVLAKQGFVVPIVVNQRIRSYELSEFTKNHVQEIKRQGK